MTKNDIVCAISWLYPNGFVGFDNRLPTPSTYDEYLISINKASKIWRAPQYPILTQKEILDAAEQYRSSLKC